LGLRLRLLESEEFIAMTNGYGAGIWPACLMAALFIPGSVALAAAPAKAPVCRVHIGGVRDLRPAEAITPAVVGDKPVVADDPVAWLSQAMGGLARDGTLSLVNENADLDVSIDLVKSYIINQATSKSANVVARVHYSRGAAPPEDKVYRGVDATVNWISGKSENRGALNQALSQVIDAVRADALQRCGEAATPTPPKT
jgi:hypothetical protein